MPLYFFYLYDDSRAGYDDRLVEADSIDNAVAKAQSLIMEGWAKIEVISAQKDRKILRRVVSRNILVTGVPDVEKRNEVI